MEFILLSLFFFNDTATTEIYTLSLHDALPIYESAADICGEKAHPVVRRDCRQHAGLLNDLAQTEHADRSEPDEQDRKSTRLNSSHDQISYAVFCLKKKKNLPRYGPARHRQTTH